MQGTRKKMKRHENKIEGTWQTNVPIQKDNQRRMACSGLLKSGRGVDPFYLASGLPPARQAPKNLSVNPPFLGHVLKRLATLRMHVVCRVVLHINGQSVSVFLFSFMFPSCFRPFPFTSFYFLSVPLNSCAFRLISCNFLCIDFYFLLFPFISW